VLHRVSLYIIFDKGKWHLMMCACVYVDTYACECVHSLFPYICVSNNISQLSEGISFQATRRNVSYK
jgi:hypothetical protein